MTRPRRARTRANGGDHEPSATILVVDPDAARRAELVASVAGDGRRVVDVPDTAAATEHLRAAVDLVLLGTDATDDDHLDLLVRLRTDPRLRPVPLLFVTPPEVGDDVVRRFCLDAHDRVDAPADPDVLLNLVAERLGRPAPTADDLPTDQATGLVTTDRLEAELTREHQRVARGAADGVVAMLSLPEPALVDELGQRAFQVLVRTAGARILTVARPLDVLGRLAPGELLLLMPDTAPSEAERRLDAIARAVADHPITIHGEPHHLVVSTGYARLGDGRRPQDVVARARAAAAHAGSRLDDRPVRWTPAMESGLPAHVLAPWTARPIPRRWPLAGRLRTPAVLAVSLAIAVGLPLLVLTVSDARGFDASWLMLGIGGASLLATAVGTLVGGRHARRDASTTNTPSVADPPATAILVAHLPDVSATILETIEAFRRLETPVTQIVVAYHTPHPLPVETRMRRVATDDDRVTVMRVEGSTSLVHDVTAALAITTGDYVGIFTASQHPAPNAFRRAWRALSQGSDVVQGHDLIRNGSTSRTARRVAVDHEAATPADARARRRDRAFPLAGGPNAYWRTELLRTIGLRGPHLVDDLETAVLVAEAGGVIDVEPRLIARTLAPRTWRGWWSGVQDADHPWHRRALRGLGKGLRSRRLTGRQRFDIARFVLWREVSPWTNLLVVPVIVHWVATGAAAQRLAFVAAAAGVFVLAIGPPRTLVARWIGQPDVLHARWMLGHLVSTALVHAHVRDAATRIAQLRRFRDDIDDTRGHPPRQASAPDDGLTEG